MSCWSGPGEIYQKYADWTLEGFWQIGVVDTKTEVFSMIPGRGDIKKNSAYMKRIHELAKWLETESDLKGHNKKANRKEIIERYVQTWIKKDMTEFAEIFAEDIVYTESYGPRHHGLTEIVSIIKFNKENKIVSVNEFQSKAEHYYPYRRLD